MPSIRDVAKLAGVAPITVSRVMNNSGYVSDEKRDRVKAAVAELQYVPNSLARSLRSKSTKMVALLLFDVMNPFWMQVLRGVEDVVSQHGFNLILANTDESAAKQSRSSTTLLEKQVDGIILVPAQSVTAPVELIRSQKVELVVIDRSVPSDEVDIVRCDSEQGAFDIVTHLINLGHKEIALFSGPTTVSTARDRLQGYRRALNNAGIMFQEELCFYGEFTRDSGYQMAQELLQRSHRPTAIFSSDYFAAVGALQALNEAQVDIPADMAFVTFDNMLPELQIAPFLTVVNQPAYEMGQQAAQLLFQRLNGYSPAEYREIVLPTELIVRQSCGASLAA